MTLRVGQRVRVLGSETVGIIRRLQSAKVSPTRDARAQLWTISTTPECSGVLVWHRQHDLLTESADQWHSKEARDDA